MKIGVAWERYFFNILHERPFLIFYYIAVFLKDNAFYATKVVASAKLNNRFLSLADNSILYFRAFFYDIFFKRRCMRTAKDDVKSAYGVHSFYQAVDVLVFHSHHACAYKVWLEPFYALFYL